MRILIFVLLLSGLLPIGFRAKTFAQANRYNVPAEVYEWFMEVTRDGISLDDIAQAEAMASEAGRKGDYASQELCWSVLAMYYRNKGPYSELRQWCDSMRSLTDLTAGKQTMWHFWAYHTEIGFLVDNGQLFAAIALADRLREEAEERQDAYGIFTALTSVADIYRLRGDLGLAGENYERALEYQKENLPDVDASELYIYLSSYYRRKSNRTQADMEYAKELVEQGLAIAVDPSIRGRLLLEKAMSLYSEPDVSKFMEMYDSCERYFVDDAVNPEYLQLKYRKYILEREYDKAYETLKDLDAEYDKYIARYMIKKAQGDYREALYNYERATHELNLIREQESRGDLADISANIGKLQLEVAHHQLERQREKVSSQRTQMALAAVVLLCLLIGGSLIAMVLFNRKTRQSNLQLAQKNEELIQARDKALESERMKMMFVQNMSHEIRTPLNAIVGFSSLLTQKNAMLDEKKAEQFRDIINYNGELLTTLIDDVLTISDLESGRYLLNYSMTEVNKVGRMAVETAKSRLQPGVKMIFSTSVSDGFAVETDEKRVWQVINNLLVNACKHTEKGSITLDVSMPGPECVRFIVSDNGPGIEPDKRQAVFERFTKYNKYVQGTGLGLNICKMLADKLGGNIFLDMEYKDGARFVFDIAVTG